MKNQIATPPRLLYTGLLAMLFLLSTTALADGPRDNAADIGAHEYGGQRVVAQYSGRTLFAELPSSVRVGAVIAAADENFRSHGYTVLDKDSTDDEGRCVAHAPGKDITRVVVRSKRGAHGTEVTVVYEPFGEEELSRYHFDGILQHLSK